jgi:hypothetical protein
LDKTDRQNEQVSTSTWIVVGLIFSAVIVALYAPFVLELAQRGSA